MNHRRHSSEQGARRVQARENVSTTQVEHRSQEGSSLRPSVCRGGIISTRSQSLVPLWDVSPIRKIRQGRQCDQRGEGQIKLGCATGVANCGVALLGRDYVTTSTKSRAHGVVASHPHSEVPGFKPQCVQSSSGLPFRNCGECTWSSGNSFASHAQDPACNTQCVED